MTELTTAREMLRDAQARLRTANRKLSNLKQPSRQTVDAVGVDHILHSRRHAELEREQARADVTGWQRTVAQLAGETVATAKPRGFVRLGTPIMDRKRQLAEALRQRGTTGRGYLCKVMRPG
jgi:hypothetical protein